MEWLNQVLFVHRSHKGLQYLNLLNSYTKLKSFQISLLVVEIFIVVVVGTGQLTKACFFCQIISRQILFRLPSERSLTYLSTMSALTTVCPSFCFNAWSKEMTINATEERGKIVTPWPVVSVTVRTNSDSDTAKIIAKIFMKIHWYL